MGVRSGQKLVGVAEYNLSWQSAFLIGKVVEVRRNAPGISLFVP